MRVDIGAHLGHWPFQRMRATTPDSLAEQMRELGVDLSVVSNLNGLFYANCQDANEELAEWLKADRRHRDRFVPLAVLNPVYAGWRRDLQRCHAELGMRGLRLYPQYHDYDFSEPRLHELLVAARDLDWPVCFSLRMINALGRSWLDVHRVQLGTEQWLLDEMLPVLTGVPGLKVVILQTNFMKVSPATVAALQAARVLFDTSRASGLQVAAFNAYDLHEAIAQYGAAKFAYGSMSPFGDPISPVLRLESSGLAPAELERLWSENARTCFNL